MKNTRVKIIKPLYLGIFILHISKTLMYQFWHDYIGPKYRDRAKLCYTDTDILLTLKQRIFAMMLRDGLIHLTMIKMLKDLFQ